MDFSLSESEVRVLGCLIEKEMATPEYYPLSLNALANACNQKTNREPVTDYTDEIVVRALDGLRKKGFVWQSDASRVPKYGQNFIQNYKLINKEAALLSVLFLRGPQTIGELRGRTERLYNFPDLDVVAESLSALEENSFVKKLPRQAGRKESRYAHLLSGEPENVDALTAQPEPARFAVAAEEDRIAGILGEVEGLRQELFDLKKDFVNFKKQFE